MKTFRTRSFLVIGSVGLFALSLLNGCRKEEDPDTDATAGIDNALAEATFSDVIVISDESQRGQLSTFSVGQSNALLSTCATVTLDTLNNGSNPDTAVVDFGNSNCLCKDARNRRGKIIASYTGRYKDAGTVIHITFDNYFVNDHQVLGTKTITNMGRNNQNQQQYKVVVDGKIIKPNNGGTILWKATKYRTWIAGENTPLNFMDDVYALEGNADGTSASGMQYTMQITSALIRRLDCPKHFVSGTFDITPQGKLKRSIDFGNGACDNKVTLTIAGKSMEVSL